MTIEANLGSVYRMSRSPDFVFVFCMSFRVRGTKQFNLHNRKAESACDILHQVSSFICYYYLAIYLLSRSLSLFYDPLVGTEPVHSSPEKRK